MRAYIDLNFINRLEKLGKLGQPEKAHFIRHYFHCLKSNLFSQHILMHILMTCFGDTKKIQII